MRDSRCEEGVWGILAGGERSFTTVAFALALGEFSGSPFRAMDEFGELMLFYPARCALPCSIDVRLTGLPAVLQMCSCELTLGLYLPSQALLMSQSAIAFRMRWPIVV